MEDAQHDTQHVLCIQLGFDSPERNKPATNPCTGGAGRDGLRSF